MDHNLSDVFDKIAPKSKEDVQRRREKHRMRDEMYDMQPRRSSNYDQEFHTRK